MNDDTHPIGGSAWEPAPAPVPGARGPASSETASAPATGDPAAMAAGPTSRGARWRSRFTGSSTRRRGTLVGAAVGLVAVSGLGGFAWGHAAADRGAGFADRGQVGPPFGRDVDGDGDHHGLPGGPPPPGTPGYLPGRPPGDLDGDGTDGADGGSDDDLGTDSGTTRPGSQT